MFGGETRRRGKLTRCFCSTVKAGQPKWTFVDYAPGAIAPPKRTGHTTVTDGDCIYVFVSALLLSIFFSC